MISHSFEPAPMPPAAIIAMPAHARQAPSSIYETTVARLAEVTRSVRLDAAADAPCGAGRTLPGTHTDPRNLI